MLTLSPIGAAKLGACQPALDRLLAHLGRRPAPNEEIPLTAVMDANPDDVADVCWILARIDQPMLVRWATDCAEAAALAAESGVAAQEARNPAEMRPRAALTAAADLRRAMRAGAPHEEIQILMTAARGAAAHAADAAYAYACVYVHAADADADADAYADAHAAYAAADAADCASACTSAAFAAYAASYVFVVAAYAIVASHRIMRRWCRKRLRAYLEVRDPGPVVA